MWHHLQYNGHHVPMDGISKFIAKTRKTIMMLIRRRLKWIIRPKRSLFVGANPIRTIGSVHVKMLKEYEKPFKIDMFMTQYELLLIKEGELIQDMYTRFIGISNELHCLYKVIKPRKLIHKIICASYVTGKKTLHNFWSKRSKKSYHRCVAWVIEDLWDQEATRPTAT